MSLDNEMVNLQKAIENGHRKIVDLSIKMVIFHNHSIS
jgi:hypothetical protein